MTEGQREGKRGDKVQSSREAHEAVDRGRDQIKPSAEPKTVLLQGSRSNEPSRRIMAAECQSPWRCQMQMMT